MSHLKFILNNNMIRFQLIVACSLCILWGGLASADVSADKTRIQKLEEKSAALTKELERLEAIDKNPEKLNSQWDSLTTDQRRRVRDSLEKAIQKARMELQKIQKALDIVAFNKARVAAYEEKSKAEAAEKAEKEHQQTLKKQAEEKKAKPEQHWTIFLIVLAGVIVAGVVLFAFLKPGKRKKKLAKAPKARFSLAKAAKEAEERRQSLKKK